MNQNVVFEDNVITVSNQKYYVLKQLVFDNVLYLLANKLKDDVTPSDSMTVLTVTKLENGYHIEPEQDDKKIAQVLPIFADLLDTIETTN